MKLFEIGDGTLSMKVPGNFYSDWEDDGTVQLYDPAVDFAEIRISVITVEPADSGDTEMMFKRVKKDAAEKGATARVENDKCYYSYTSDSKEDGMILFFFEVGYLNHLIVMSIFTSASFCQNNEERIEDIINEVTDFIPSITEVDADGQTIFEPAYSDFSNIDERISDILGISTEQIETCHQSGDTVALLQNIIDNKTFQADQTYELQSLGIVLGDYIRYTHPDFHWAIAKDEYGRDFCLQYKTVALVVFPLTMISKRIEDGQAVDVQEMISGLLEKVEEIAASEDFPDLGYNA